MTTLTADFWKYLLHYIDEGKVIPVLGPELCTILEGDSEIPLYTWLAGRLADEVKIPREALPANFGLNDVVSQHLKKSNDREVLYSEVSMILGRAKLRPSMALRALASIPGFTIFVSLTFDDLLATALKELRPGAEPEQQIFLPNDKKYFSTVRKDTANIQAQPLIFHLLGKLSSSREFALCEDDLLEFVHALQDKQRQPVDLFAAMREHHLLILGCGFNDWLARFFLRSMRSDDFSRPGKHSNYLVGAHVADDKNLTNYLQDFSADSKVIAMPAAEFVIELAHRWHELQEKIQAEQLVQSKQSSAVFKLAAQPTLPEHGAVFISFSSKNRLLVEGMAQELTAGRVEVWLDSKDLQPGDAWNLRIERAIGRCALFLAVISQESIHPDRRDHYFWREWNLAHERAKGHAPDLPFIIPVIVDNTKLEDLSDILHKTFTDKQGIHLPGGHITPGFAARLRELQQAYRLLEKGPR
jgi:TIR domain/SIR2-like domain